MKRVIIGLNENSKPYVISASRNVEVIFKEKKEKSLKKQWRVWFYQLKQWVRRFRTQSN